MLYVETCFVQLFVAYTCVVMCISWQDSCNSGVKSWLQLLIFDAASTTMKFFPSSSDLWSFTSTTKSQVTNFRCANSNFNCGIIMFLFLHRPKYCAREEKDHIRLIRKNDKIVFSSNGTLGRTIMESTKQCPHSPNDFDSDRQPEMTIIKLPNYKIYNCVYS